MKLILSVIASALFATACLAQNIQPCPKNPDKTYDRQKVLEQLAEILNNSIPEYKTSKKVEFSVTNERGNLFFVYDLTDASNKSTLTTVCIDFRNNHIYHFAPLDYYFSFSHIVILEDGDLKVFKSINCRNSIDKIENVTTYLVQKLKDYKDRDEILARVRNYRNYGKYYYGDRPKLGCEDENNEKILH